jgi:hypothetical protein
VLFGENVVEFGDEVVEFGLSGAAVLLGRNRREAPLPRLALRAPVVLGE